MEVPIFIILNLLIIMGVGFQHSQYYYGHHLNPIKIFEGALRIILDEEHFKYIKF